MVNYSVLAAAIEFYKRAGYTYVDVPWVVHQDVYDVTKPNYALDITVPVWDGCLVASGEQGLLSQYISGDIGVGRYVTCTPCFRDEPSGYTDTRCPYFMKVELIEFTELTDEFQITSMVHDARTFMCITSESTVLTDFKVEITGKYMCDITYNGVELGSYGYREHYIDGKKVSWIYGTGVAEPRYTLTVP